MIKKSLLFLCVLFSFFAFSNTVFAKGELVYDITNLSISDNYITFKGWAEINDYNNTGGQNVTIKIYAMKKGDNNTNNWIAADLTYHGDYNEALYNANCIKKPETQGGGCLEPYNDWPHECNGKVDSGCVYDNVGFEAKFELKKLFNKYGSGVDITFRLSFHNSTSHNRSGEGRGELAMSREV